MTQLLMVLTAVLGLMSGAAMASDTLSAEDTAQIQQLYARYNIAIDSGDAEGAGWIHLA